MRRTRIVKVHSGIDLLFADVPKNLPVPGISVSDTDIPVWNQRQPPYLENLFAYAEKNLHDDAVLLLMHSDDPQLLREIHDWAFTYDFYVAKDWWGLNELHLTSAVDLTELVCYLTCICFHFFEILFLFYYNQLVCVHSFRRGSSISRFLPRLDPNRKS